VHLRILATSDLHVHLVARDYFAGRLTPGMGLERTARLIAAARAETPNCLLLDNGDFLQGSPLGDHAARRGRLPPGTLHPAIAAMNALRYDAAALGNHEFDYGLDFLTQSLAGAAFPVLCANLVRRRGADPASDLPLVPPCMILQRQVVDLAGNAHPLRIGLIGLAPPQTVDWDGSHLHGRIEARDIMQAARAWLPRLRAEGADIVVALAHTGIGQPDPPGGAENAAAALAMLPGIDAVVAGHDHLVFPSARFADLPGVDPARGTIGGTPTVMPGYGGSHLGVIDLALAPCGTGWRVTDARAEARAVAAASLPRRGDPAVRCAVDRDHRATIRRLRRRVGTTTTPLHSFFALVADCASLRLVCDAQADHVRAALAGTDHAHLPVLSAAAPFKAGGRGGPANYTDVPAGRLALRDVADLYAFPNTLRAVRVTGAELAEWLERSAALFCRLQPGLADQPLINPDFRSHNFDVIAGVTYAIDPTEPARYDAEGRLIDPAAHRLRDLCHQGRPVDPQAEFVVATNSYRVALRQRDASPGFRVILSPAVSNRDILLRHIAARAVVAPTEASSWRLIVPPGTSALFDTSPRAVAHLAGLPGLTLESAGDAPGGFARIRIRV
jgi:2',3'-cyclic-nucleotide 2'-phosphodiesterase/3'-nucleotidase